MALLVLGLILFLGAHSVRMLAGPWRARAIERVGAGPWKGLYALVSAAGFVLIIWGFGSARQHPVALYAPPPALRHLNALFTLLAFILLAAAYVPRNHLKQAVGHPMVAGVAVWATGHVLATGWTHDLVLFGAMLTWALIEFMSLRARDRGLGTVYPTGTVGGDVLAIGIGAAAWVIFAFWLHVRWIGVRPFA